MKLIATVLAAFLAAAAVAEAKETRLLGSKASAKAGKGSKGSKGSKGNSYSYSYSMSYPPTPSCAELNEKYDPLYIVEFELGGPPPRPVTYQLQQMDGSTNDPLELSEECARYTACSRGYVLATPQSLEQSLATCWEENADPSPEEQLTPTGPVYIFQGAQDNCGNNPCPQ